MLKDEESIQNVSQQCLKLRNIQLKQILQNHKLKNPMKEVNLDTIDGGLNIRIDAVQTAEKYGEKFTKNAPTKIAQEMMRISSHFLSDEEMHAHVNPSAVRMRTYENSDHFSRRIQHTEQAFIAMMIATVYLGIRDGLNIWIAKTRIAQAWPLLIEEVRLRILQEKKARDETKNARHELKRYKKKQSIKKWKKKTKGGNSKIKNAKIKKSTTNKLMKKSTGCSKCLSKNHGTKLCPFDKGKLL